MNLKLIKASIEQKPILANLLELYAYEFTKFCDNDIGDNGFYGYEYLPLYWTDESRIPYLIYVNEKIAGFALVQKMTSIIDEKDVWDMTEFFILQKYQKKGVGQQAVKKILATYQGSWQVRVLIENKIAIQFWDKTIHQYVKQKPCILKKTINDNDEEWLIYRFE